MLKKKDTVPFKESYELRCYFIKGHEFFCQTCMSAMLGTTKQPSDFIMGYRYNNDTCHGCSRGLGDCYQPEPEPEGE